MTALQPLRVVNLLEEGSVGGPQRRSVAVAAALNRRTDLAIETTLLFPDTARELQAACDQAGVAYVCLPMDALSRKRSAALRYAATFVPQTIGVARALRRLRADVLHVSGGTFCYKGPFAARVTQTPFAWHLNDTRSDRIVRESFRLVTKVTRPRHLIFAATAVQDSYARWLSNTPGSVVPAPVRDNLDALAFAATPDPYPAGPRPRVLMLANINPVKGLDAAIQAIAHCSTGARLFIAGGVKSTQVGLNDQLRSLASETGAEVEFLGHLGDVAPYLTHADISLCSSLAEASPLAVWEAAAAAKPIVSTDVGDVARLLPHEQAALIVPVGDIHAMAASIDRLAAEPEFATRLGQRAREAMLANTSIDLVAELSAQAYRASHAR